MTYRDVIVETARILVQRRMGVRNVFDAWRCCIAVKIDSVLTGQFIKNTAVDGPVLHCVIGFCYIKDFICFCGLL